MAFEFIEDEHERHAFTVAVGVVALSILSVIAFVLSGGSPIFYLIVLVAIILGFYMSWHVSKHPVEGGAEAKSALGSRKRARKR